MARERVDLAQRIWLDNDRRVRDIDAAELGGEVDRSRRHVQESAGASRGPSSIPTS
jgi:hypothetical protein